MQISLKGQPVHIATGGRKPAPGQGAGMPPLLLLHGSGQSHVTWLLQSRWLAHHGFCVYAVDFPGHGLSGGEPLASVSEQASWISALADALELDDMVLVGHSQGCLVALETASQMPDRCRALVLIAAALAIPVNDSLLQMAQNDPPAAARLMTSWGHSSEARRHQHSQPGFSHLGFGRRLMAGNHSAALAMDLAACQAYENGPAAAASLKQPALVLLAGQDRMTPLKAGKAMAASLAAAETLILEKAGHMLPAERPAEINQAIAAFMTRHFGPLAGQQ